MNDISSLLFFVGYGHSGHSLLGAIIDSHRKAAISNELNAVQLLLDHCLAPDELIKRILRSAASNGRDGAWLNTGYSYRFPGTFQGHVTEATVVGDKRAGGTARALAPDPSKVLAIDALFAGNTKWIFPERNPWDIVAAMSFRRNALLSIQLVESFVKQVHAVDAAWNFIPADKKLLVRNEDLIAEPIAVMQTIFDFLGLEINRAFLDRLLPFISRTPSERRYRAAWEAGTLEHLTDQLRQFPGRFSAQHY